MHLQRGGVSRPGDGLFPSRLGRMPATQRPDRHLGRHYVFPACPWARHTPHSVTQRRLTARRSCDLDRRYTSE